MYYRVRAKCGHVGRNNYIEKTFYVESASGKEAAYKVRYLPRVKHDRKDAILSVDKITYDEFTAGLQQNREDKYFYVKSSTEQRLTSAVRDEEIKRERVRESDERSRNIGFIIRRQRIMEKHYNKMLLEVCNG